MSSRHCCVPPSAGMLHGLVGFCFDVICCRFKLGAYRPREVKANHLVFTTTDTWGFCFTVLRWRSNGLWWIFSRTCGNRWTMWPITRLRCWLNRHLRSSFLSLTPGWWTFLQREGYPVLFNPLLFPVSPFVMKLCFCYYQKEVLLWNYCEACLLKIFPHTRYLS